MGRRRSLRTLVLVLALLGTAPTRAHAQALDPATEALLQASGAEVVLAGIHGEIDRLLRILGVEPTQAQVDVLTRYLDPAPLLAVMGEELQRLGDADTREAAARLLATGAIARVDSLRDAEPPSVTFDEFVARLEERPPPQARIQLMNDVVAGQAAGPAQVLLAERIREAGHRIARATGATVEPFAPLTQADWVARAEEAHSQTLISFLHEYENVPDDLLEARVQVWLTDAGAWFSEAYSVALAETVSRAADSAATALRGS
jgi:hypothetical protein